MGEKKFKDGFGSNSEGEKKFNSVRKWQQLFFEKCCPQKKNPSLYEKYRAKTKSICFMLGWASNKKYPSFALFSFPQRREREREREREGKNCFLKIKEKKRKERKGKKRVDEKDLFCVRWAWKCFAALTWRIHSRLGLGFEPGLALIDREARDFHSIKIKHHWIGDWILFFRLKETET